LAIGECDHAASKACQNMAALRVTTLPFVLVSSKRW